MAPTLLFLFAVASLIMIATRLVVARRRLRALFRHGQVVAWKDRISTLTPETKVVHVDLGFGAEVWIVDAGNMAIDRSTRAFEKGVLIYPRPRMSVVQAACRNRGVEILRLFHRF